MRTGVVLAMLLLIGAVASAEDAPTPPPTTPSVVPAAKPAPPLTPEQAADAVLAAIKAKDDAALKALAAKDDPDPWLVADALVGDGNIDAAEAFAKAAKPSKDVERLPAWVASRRGKPDDAAARKSLAVANAALGAGRPGDVLGALGPALSAVHRDVTSILLELTRGEALRSSGRLAESARAFDETATAAGELGWLALAARALDESGYSAYLWSDYPAALAATERRLLVQEARRHPAGIADTLGNLGSVLESMGAHAKALGYQERARSMSETLGDRAGAATSLRNIAIIHSALGDYEKALESLDGARRIWNELKDGAGVGGTLGSIGSVHSELGDFARALDAFERALELLAAAGDHRGAAEILGNTGLVYYALGDLDLALACHEQALAQKQRLGDRRGAAQTLRNLGNVHHSRRDGVRALRCHRQALALATELGDRDEQATEWENIGLVLGATGESRQSLEMHRRALRMKQESGDSFGVAFSLVSIATLLDRLGDFVGSGEHAERALRAATEARASVTAVEAGACLALSRLRVGDPRAAVAIARRALEELAHLAVGVSESQRTGFREQFASVYEVGARAACAMTSVDDVSFFLESGRAGSLLESLRGRTTLRAATLPDGLRRAEAETRASQASAVAAYRQALASGDIAAIKSRRTAMEAAQDVARVVFERIEREAKRAARVLHPAADVLAVIRERLAADEALVLYGLFYEESIALVVTKSTATLAKLAPTRAIEAGCDSLLHEVEERTHSEIGAKTADALRALVLDPLELPPNSKRLLVSPDGPLSYVPFALLAPDREIVYVPSGTTYGQLLEDGRIRGDGVLALGDPDYETKVDGRAVGIFHRGNPGRLSRLPATADEAKAVGATVLLGKDATERRLRDAVATKPRWRAVHLACHGLLDSERPAFSSLALTPDGTDDGFLTSLDVFRMTIPADLVVLSACETAKGKVVKTEGIVGLTRAFMYAGTPRVICSLWKVDDDATRALMVKFYELWNPKDGKPGLPTATALKQAQEFVRSHEKWKHPYYWAAWVLWGLPS